jgi:GntR family transcriptional regulator
MQRRRGRVSGVTRYREIARQIAADIAAGRYPVGSLLPTEAEFSQRMEAGRHTVREALRMLSQDGWIVRRAGSGSTVVSNSQRQVFAHAVSNFDQWFNYPEGVLRQHLDHAMIEADSTLADRIGCQVGAPWLRISAVRTVADRVEPLCWVDLYLQPRFAAVLQSKDLDAQPVHEQVERLFDVQIAEVQVKVSASRVPLELATALHVEPDSPALLLQRRYLTAGGELLQATQTVHPENRYVYEMRFRREARGRYG